MWVPIFTKHSTTVYKSSETQDSTSRLPHEEIASCRRWQLTQRHPQMVRIQRIRDTGIFEEEGTEGLEDPEAAGDVKKTVV